MKSCVRKINMLLGILCLSVCFTGCGNRQLKISASDVAMGTVVQKTLYVEDEQLGKTAMEEINACIERYETEVLSWREDGSQVARINADAGKEEGSPLEPDLETELQKIREISQKSDGALDVTIGQVTRLWNLDKWSMGSEEEQNFAPPSQEDINALLEVAGYEKVEINNGRIYLPTSMQLDLGAVGKGIVCDKIGEYLREQTGITGAVITLGGSVVTYGTKPDGNSWQVAVAHPREDGAYLGTLSLQGEYYVATSGDYERYVELNGTRYHHIMDPSTGYPADTNVCSVTIISESGLVSDALSTACFVLGVEEGMALAEEYGAQALFVTKDMEIIMTQGMDALFNESRKD